MSARSARFHGGVWIGVMLAPMRTAAVVALAGLALLVCAWLVHGIAADEDDWAGIEYLKGVLVQDLEHATSLASAQGVPSALSGAIVNLPYWLLFEMTGIHAMGQRFSDVESLAIPDTIVRRTYVRHHRSIEIAMLVAQLVGIRIAITLHAIPLVALFYLLALVDGLHRREIRRVMGCRESASLYHRAKYLQVCVVVMAVASIVLWPWAVNGHYVGLLLGVTLGVLSAWQWRFYKKYL